MDRKMFQNIALSLLLSLSLFSCKKDKPDGGTTILPNDTTAKVLIVCEGSLGNGNATLSVYAPQTDSVFNDVYQNANGLALGDVFQSVFKQDNQYFFCVNNSDKITVVDQNSWRQKASISVPKPRYTLRVSDQKAYVGSLFSNRIYIINTKSFLVEKTIELPFQNAEGMLLKDGMVYVCCWDTACNKLYKIDASSDKLVDSISLAGSAAQSVLLDKENKIWVMGGNAYKNKSTHLNRIDLNSKKVIQSFIFDKKIEAIKPCFNPARDTLYFLEVNYSGGIVNNGVYRMPIGFSSLPTAAFVSCQANQYFWALGVDPNSGNIYVGDPKGFVQKGSVSIFNQQAQLQHSFNVGLGVGGFYFD